MAAPVPKPVKVEEVQQLFGAATGEKGLAPLFLCPCDEEGTVLFRSIAFVVRCRPGGFMVVTPAADAISDFVAVNEHLFGSHHCEVLCVQAKGRKTHELPAIFLDVPWEHVGHFTKVTSLKGEALKQAVRFRVGEQYAKPLPDSANFAANVWIQSAMDEDTAGEYGTAESGEDVDGEPLTETELFAALDAPAGGVDTEVVMQMQSRIQALEAELSASKAGAPAPTLGGPRLFTPPTAKAAGTSLLGPNLTAGRDPQILSKLQALAGSGPARLGAHERAVRKEQPTTVLDTALQEEDLGAAEETELQDALEETLAAASDPMQKLLVLQAQQLNLLTKQVASRQVADPIQRALGGSDSSSSSGSGLRGCLARDAYLKISADLTKIAEVGERQALQDLGLLSSGMTPGLLQEYLERRVPVGEHRLLTQVAYMMASAYEVGSRSDNRELQGFAVKGMMFCDQAAIDNGRTNLAWLMTGLPEPNYQLCQRNRQRSTLQPFTRLANPAWVAANISYLRDLDFLDGKIQAAGKPTKDKDTVKSDEKSEAAPKPKRKPKGKGKGPAPAQAGEDTAAI